jgi:integrase/recombinase XerC
MSSSTFRMRDTVRRFAAAKRSPRTAKTYGLIAEDFLAFMGDRIPDHRSVEQFLARPLKSGGRAAISTYNQALAALRAYARFAVKEGAWQSDPTEHLTFERAEPKDPAVLFVPEVVRFIRAVRDVASPELFARDLAIVATLFTVGLRVSEAAQLDLLQLDLTTDVFLNVRRKGGRLQNLAIEPKTAQILRNWVGERPCVARPGERALFVSSTGRRLSARAFQRLFERIRTFLDMPKHVTPHTGRHSFVTNGLMLGGEITAVSRAAGHASIATTMRYRHFIDSELRSVVVLLGSVIPSELVRESSDDGAPATDIGTGLDLGVVNKTGAAPPANDGLDAQENLDDIAPQAAQ